MGKISKYKRFCILHGLYKSEKTDILASKYTFLCIDSLSQTISQIFIELGMYNFVSSVHDAVAKHNWQMIFRGHCMDV
jgi:hypothetical protein